MLAKTAICKMKRDIHNFGQYVETLNINPKCYSVECQCLSVLLRKNSKYEFRKIDNEQQTCRL